jgi:hypothetical protein
VTRRLRLRKETLTELNADALSWVAGGSQGCVTYTIVVTGCWCSGAYPSLNVDCHSLDCTPPTF